MPHIRFGSTGAISCFFIVALLGTSLHAEEKTRTVPERGPVKIDRACPSLAGFTLDNAVLSLREVVRPPKGEPARAVILSFFATWCEPCKKQLPKLLKVASALRSRGVRLLLIAYNEDVDKVKPFAVEHGIADPIIVDPFAKISQRLGVSETLPRTFIIDGEGRVRTIFDHRGR